MSTWQCGEDKHEGKQPRVLQCLSSPANQQHTLASPCVCLVWETGHPPTALHTAVLEAWLFQGSALHFYVASHLSTGEKLKEKDKEACLPLHGSLNSNY